MRKKREKTKSSKQVEIELDLPKVSLTGFSMMSAIILLSISLSGFSGYFAVKSIWNFTHPKFNISLDTFKAIGYIASGQNLPAIGLPSFPDGMGPTDLEKSEFNSALPAFRSEFREKFPGSRLAQLPDNVLIGLAWSFCQAKDEAVTKTGKFVPQEIIDAHQAKLLLRYPFVAGLNEFVDGIGQLAFQTLCKGP